MAEFEQWHLEEPPEGNLSRQGEGANRERDKATAATWVRLAPIQLQVA
jgi:hypothetical protein